MRSSSPSSSPGTLAAQAAQCPQVFPAAVERPCWTQRCGCEGTQLLTGDRQRTAVTHSPASPHLCPPTADGQSWEVELRTKTGPPIGRSLPSADLVRTEHVSRTVSALCYARPTGDSSCVLALVSTQDSGLGDTRQGHHQLAWGSQSHRAHPSGVCLLGQGSRCLSCPQALEMEVQQAGERQSGRKGLQIHPVEPTLGNPYGE